MFCGNCGRQLPEGAQVCPQCGTKVAKDIDFSDEMYRKLEITDRELEELKAKSIWYVDVVDKYDFEDNI